MGEQKGKNQGTAERGQERKVRELCFEVYSVGFGGSISVMI
jgi:hypothetical protein